MTDMTVARTILQQLGGNQFVVITGARGFSGNHNSLTFRFPQPGKGKPNLCNVTLTPRDEYDVYFFYAKGAANAPRLIEKHEGVYCDQLRGLFEKATGLSTSLTRRYAV